MIRKIKMITKTTITNHKTAQKYVSTASPDPFQISIEDVIDRIIKLNEGLRNFWTKSLGWAPISAAHLLNKSRLDWQVSLSHCLKLWVVQPPAAGSDGYLILGWSNLGSLVEGTMKLFLAAYYETYKNDKEYAIMKKNAIKCPDELQLETLCHYFRKRIWDDSWDQRIRVIQKRRNAIHAFKDRDIGTQHDYIENVKHYLNLLRYINFRLPYPDEVYIPKESDIQVETESHITIKYSKK